MINHHECSIHPTTICLLATLLSLGCAHAQSDRNTLAPRRAHTEMEQPGVVLVALGIGTADDIAQRAMIEELVGAGMDVSQDVSWDLTSVQLQIAATAAETTTAVVLVPSYAVERDVRDKCDVFGLGLCDAIQEGRIVFRESSHEGPWIRDYGPQVFHDGRRTIALDLRYTGDPRSRGRIAKMRTKYNKLRYELLETQARHLEQGEQAPDSLEKHIEILNGLIEATSDPLLGSRLEDDQSFNSIVHTLLSPKRLSLTASSLSIEGGNLLRLEDGRCLTTTDLVQQNESDSSSVERSLRRELGCRAVTFLEPLPDTIAHVDMFVLPVRGKKLLLASYDVTEDEDLQAQYLTSTSDVRAATQRAAIAMKNNRDLLVSLGYSVDEIPSLLPEPNGNGDLWYPTLLNALIYTGTDGGTRVIAPEYADRANEVQKRAKAEIVRAFGPQVDTRFVESTVAAQRMGAVHCLSLVVPQPAVELAGIPRSIEQFRDELEDMEEEHARRQAKAAKRAEALLIGEWHDPLWGIELTFEPNGMVRQRMGTGEAVVEAWSVTAIVDKTSTHETPTYELSIGMQSMTASFLADGTLEMTMSDIDWPMRLFRGALPTESSQTESSQTESSQTDSFVD